MTRRRNRGVLGSVALALAVAEGARRLLTPRSDMIEPAPVDLRAYFSESEIERGASFARPQLALALARAVVDVAALSLFVFRPPGIMKRRFGHPVRAGAAAGGALSVVLALPSLPIAAIARKRAIAVGLITQSWRGWGVDLLKGAAIQGVLASAAGGAVVFVIRRYPRGWWLPAAGGTIGFGAVLAALAPVLLDPIFNDFTPLPEGVTRTDVLSLAATAGVKVREVYAVDASRRTTAVNAYVNGLGPTKRVVLFDTLLDGFDREQVRVVVAHELAHVRYRDVPRGVLYAAIVAPAAGFAVQRLSSALAARAGEPVMLPSLALAAGLVATPVGLVGNGLSRGIERRADAFSLQLSRAPEAFISFERAIALQNVADLDPPRWVERLLATHPSTIERIGFAVTYANRAGAQAPASYSGS